MYIVPFFYITIKTQNNEKNIIGSSNANGNIGPESPNQHPRDVRL